jgi:argininosuccinate synthase
MSKKAILAFSGGLDTSVCVKYLQFDHNLDVVTVTVDCGQDDNFDEIEKKAKMLGAIRHIYIDAKKEFVENYVLKSIKANGLYQGKYPLATALARPLIASKIMDIAIKEEAIAVSHGCTGKGNDQVRFDLALKSIKPKMRIIAPIRDMNLTRDVEIEFAKKHNIPIDDKAKKFSIDLNLWGRAIEGGILEDTWNEPPAGAFDMVKFEDKSTDYVEIEFKEGKPVKVDGKIYSLVDLIGYLNDRVGRHGVGVVDHIEDRVVGIKTRELYEAPAALTLIEAHRDLEKLVLTHLELRFKNIVDEHWSYMAYSGFWFDPLREDLDKFIDATQKKVTGTIRMKVKNGSLNVVGRKSPHSLYRNKLATYASDSTFDQRLAKGFVELWGMQTITANQIDKNLSTKIGEN